MQKMKKETIFEVKASYKKQIIVSKQYSVVPVPKSCKIGHIGVRNST